MLSKNFHRLTQATIILSAFGTLPAAGQTINEDFKLTSFNDGGDARFGFSIALSDGVVIVGAIHDRPDISTRFGSAYLFNASTSVQFARYSPSDGMNGAEFGSSVAIEGSVIAVGAQSDSRINLPQAGSAYLFHMSSGTQIAKLLPNDGGNSSGEFGNSIAIDNGVVAVGAWRDNDNGAESGSAYLFDASTGAQLFKLLPSDGAASDDFGISIAIDNGVVAIGASRDDDNGDRSGSVYLFDASTGAQLFKLLPSDGVAFQQFGRSVAIDNGVVAVGAWRDNENGHASGSAYLFDASTGVQLVKLLPNDGAANDGFGNSIAINNGIVAVGAIDDGDNGSVSGSAYLFNVTTGVQIYKLLPSNGGVSHQFGSSIAIDNGLVAVGASRDNHRGPNAGSAYLFSVGGASCPADLTGDGVLDFFDVSAFISAFVAGCP